LAVNGNHAHTLMHERVTLEPGDKRTLRFTPGPGELRHWNAATRDWDGSDAVRALGAAERRVVAAFEVQDAGLEV
jgi:hypothetical protein